MRKGDFKILKYVPISLFITLVIFNLIQIHLVTPINCDCGAEYSNHFLANEILNLGYVYFIYLVAKKLKLCYYNKVSVIGLAFMTILNIIAITTDFNYTMYNSIVTQISISGLLLLAVYLLIQRK